MWSPHGFSYHRDRRCLSNRIVILLAARRLARLSGLGFHEIPHRVCERRKFLHVVFAACWFVYKIGGKRMKYMLLFCGTVAEDEAFHAMPEDAKQKEYGPVMDWFRKHQSKLEGGYELQPVSTATTVRKR